MDIPEKFYEEEIRQGYRISREMKEVWGASIDMALKFVDVCQRNSLKCWMDSGTLLGAVRHKGFIPWDDDIDFVMLRKDYDKLIKIADKEFKEPYFFQTTYSDDDYYCGHAQLRNMQTASFSRSEMNRNHCKGIDIDIFVLDGFIEYPMLRFLHRTTTMLIKKSLRGYLSKNGDNKSFGKKLIAGFSKAIYSVIPYRKAFALYEQLFRMIDADKSKRVSVIAYKYSNKRRIRLRSSYESMQWMTFEHISLPAPNNTDDALRCYFGKDYMVPLHFPTAHGHKYMDASHPYSEVEKLLKQDPLLYDKRIKQLYTE